MRIMIVCLLLLAASAFAGLGLAAEDTQPQKSGATSGERQPPQPIDITADRGLEWHQKERLYVARGHAIATRGSFTIQADRLTAYERDKAHAAASSGKSAGADAANPLSMGGGATEIWRVVGDGHVHITHKRDDGKLQEAFGDHAIYDLDPDLAVLKGKNLHATSGDSLITARDSIEYWQGLGIAVARGNAVAYDSKNQRKIFSDFLVGIFVKDADGKQKLDHAEAHGHVIIVTADDYATGDTGRYNPDTDKAFLSGHVHITRGKSQIDGDNAEMDFKTNISRLSLDPAKSDGSMGRVFGLLTPEDNGKPKSKTAAGSANPALVTGSVSP